jgi:RNA polymerase sigma factor (sigma-70 family)
MRRTRSGAAGGDHALMTPREFEVFYEAEYPKLVKFLVVAERASFDEAENAVQNAMMDFLRRSRAGTAVDHPAAYVRTAARNSFLGERERDRQRLPRTLRGGHLAPEGHHDDRLDAWTEQQHAEDLLAGLTPARREVARLLIDGMTTGEIAEELGKTQANIRQLRKQIKEHIRPLPGPGANGRVRQARVPGPEREQKPTAPAPKPRKEEVR